MAFIVFFLLLKKVEKYFRANTQTSNLNVLHKGLLLQDWVFRLGLQPYYIFKYNLMIHMYLSADCSPFCHFIYNKMPLMKQHLDNFSTKIANVFFL